MGIGAVRLEGELGVPLVGQGPVGGGTGQTGLPHTGGTVVEELGEGERTTAAVHQRSPGEIVGHADDLSGLEGRVDGAVVGAGGVDDPVAHRRTLDEVDRRQVGALLHQVAVDVVTVVGAVSPEHEAPGGRATVNGVTEPPDRSGVAAVSPGGARVAAPAECTRHRRER